MIINPPTTPEEYINYNCEDVLSYIRKTYAGTMKKRYVIFYGPAGSGKTTLANVIANDQNLTLRYSNASDARRLKDINENDYLTRGLIDEKVMIVLDECEAMMGATWKRIDELAELNTKIPIILITNTLSKIPEKIRKKAIEKEIKVNRFSIKAFVKRTNTLMDLQLTSTQIDAIVDKSTSFRHAITLLEWGFCDDVEVSVTLQEQILSALHGDYTEFKYDNTKNVELISQADIYLNRYKHGYRYGKYIVNACLNAIRSKKTKLDNSRTGFLIKSARNKKDGVKQKKTQKKTPNIRITGVKL